jgi:hypothetical protein
MAKHLLRLSPYQKGILTKLLTKSPMPVLDAILDAGSESARRV